MKRAIKRRIEVLKAMLDSKTVNDKLLPPSQAPSKPPTHKQSRENWSFIQEDWPSSGTFALAKDNQPTDPKSNRKQDDSFTNSSKLKSAKLKSEDVDDIPKAPSIRKQAPSSAPEAWYVPPFKTEAKQASSIPKRPLDSSEDESNSKRQRKVSTDDSQDLVGSVNPKSNNSHSRDSAVDSSNLKHDDSVERKPSERKESPNLSPVAQSVSKSNNHVKDDS